MCNTLSNDSVPTKKCILYRKYFRYRHKTNTIVLTILSAIISLAPLLAELAYSPMLFILQLMHTVQYASAEE